MTQSSGSIHRFPLATLSPTVFWRLLKTYPNPRIGRNFHWVAGAAVVADDHVWERRPQVSTPHPFWAFDDCGALANS